MQNERLRNESLREMIHDYNENINYYNSNMRRMIEIMSINDNINNNNNTNNNTNNRPNNRPNNNFTNMQNIFTNTIRSGFNQFRNNVQNRFEDVIVRPTIFQINNAIENLIFDPNEVYSNREYTRVLSLDVSYCPITMTEFEPGNIISRIKTCGHIFSKDALTNWFSRNVRCPICRFDIRETPIDIQTPVQETISPVYQRINNEITDEQMSHLDRELDNLVIGEEIQYNPNSTTDISSNTSPTTNTTSITNLLSNFIRNELRDNINISELIYTFNIPFDSSNNLYH